MARYTQISIDEVLSRTKAQLRITNTTEHDDYLSLMVYEAVRHLGAMSTFIKKQCNIDIVDGKSKLPGDFYRLLGVRATGSSSEAGNNPFLSGGTCVTQLYVDKKFLSDCGCDLTTNFTVDYNEGFQINNGYIYWNSTTNAITTTMAYLAMNVDDNGRLLIYEDYERAVSSYACHMFTLSYPDLYRESTIERYRKDWITQKSWVRGNEQANYFQNAKREVGAIFGSLIASQIHNF